MAILVLNKGFGQKIHYFVFRVKVKAIKHCGRLFKTGLVCAEICPKHTKYVPKKRGGKDHICARMLIINQADFHAYISMFRTDL